MEKYKKLGQLESVLSMILFVSILADGILKIIYSSGLVSSFNDATLVFSGILSFLGNLVGGFIVFLAIILGMLLFAGYRSRYVSKSLYSIFSILFIVFCYIYIALFFIPLISHSIVFNLSSVLTMLASISYFILVVVKVISMFMKIELK